MNDSDRARAQKKTFTRWCNHFLSERMLKIDDLFLDFHDGWKLHQLLELISAKKLKKIKKKTKNDYAKIENIGVSFKFLKSENLKLVNIDAKDIFDGNPKLILGLIWTLILRYQIQFGGSSGSPKKELLDWVNKQIKPYGLQVKDFTGSFQDGKAFAYLTDSLQPGVIDNVNNLSDDKMAVANNAFEVADKEYEIPQLLDAEDSCKHPDEHSNMTYVSYFRDYLKNRDKDDGKYKIFGPDPDKCYATGKGVDGKSCFNRRPAPFTIHAINSQGDPVTDDKYKGEFLVNVKGPNFDENVECKDNGDGTWSGVYHPQKPGHYTVDIAAKGHNKGDPDQPIKGSTYELDIKEGGDPNKSYAEGEGLTRAFDDQPAFFKIYVKDKMGRPVAGEDELAVSILPSANQSSKGARGGKKPAKAVKKAAPKMEASKFCEECGAKNDGSKFCTGCGAARVYKPVGGGDAGGGSGRAPGPTKDPSEIECEITDNGDGSYDVQYAADAPGDYDLDVTIMGQSIKDMPCKLKVAKGADPSKTYATGRGVNSPGFVNRPHPFTIHCVDGDGNPIESGGHQFQAFLTGPDGRPVDIDVEDNGDGTYDGCYTPKELGNYKVDIKMDKGNGNLRAIKDNPFQIKVKTGADPDKSYAEGEGCEYAVDNRPGLFTIHANDTDGNPVPGEWVDCTLKNKNDPNGESVPVDIKDNGDGTYDVSYDCSEPGDYELDCTIGDQSIKDMPKDIKCYRGVDPSKCKVTGPGVEKGIAGHDLPFLIQARDEMGNDVPVGGDQFKPRVIDPQGNEVDCDIKDNGDGTYSGSYRPDPDMPGEYKVFLKVNDQNAPVGKSPYKVKVMPKSCGGKSYAKGPGWNYAYDNVETSFTIYANDAKGEPVIGEIVSVVFVEDKEHKEGGKMSKLMGLVDKFMLNKKAEQNKKIFETINKKRAAKGLPSIEDSEGDVPVEVVDNGDGSYTVTYTAVVPGYYKCSAMVGPQRDAEHIKHSPKSIQVRWSCPNAPCKDNCEQMHDQIREMRERIEELENR